MLEYKNLWLINHSFYKVLDTDYNTYAIVYQCTENYPKFLNFRNDDVHIFSRSDTVKDADLSTWKITAETKVAGTKARFEDLIIKECLPVSYSSQIGKMFTDPDYFFRKW